MSESVVVCWDEGLRGYDLGPAHPMRPVRLELTAALCREMGVLDRVTVFSPPTAPDDLLELVHTPDYIAAVKRAPEDIMGRLGLRYGLGTPDTPVFHRMHDVTARIVGGSVEGARAVWSGEAQHAVNFTGGLHHAMRSSASGFCVYNDASIAIAWLLANGARRVAYVDVDVHHGDGVQTAFYDDPRVLTISLHETGTALFPGTGFPKDIGVGAGEGYAVNVALPPATDDPHWLRAFHAVVPGLLRAFRPEVLVTQQGCDTHALDPLADLLLSVDAQRASYSALHGLAHELCAGRWLALGGGGYEVVQVVPRAWTHLTAIAAGVDIAPHRETPEAWRTLASQRVGEVPPLHMTDGHDAAYQPWSGGEREALDAVDRAVEATRKAVYPLHGLDPLDPRD